MDISKSMDPRDLVFLLLETLPTAQCWGFKTRLTTSYTCLSQSVSLGFYRVSASFCSPSMAAVQAVLVQGSTVSPDPLLNSPQSCPVRFVKHPVSPQSSRSRTARGCRAGTATVGH